MKNLAASIRDRLMNQARATGVPFVALLERFVIGRLLWRLSQSEVSDKFVLKGAFLKKNKLEALSLDEVITRLAMFLQPVLFPTTERSRLWKPLTGWIIPTP